MRRFHTALALLMAIGFSITSLSPANAQDDSERPVPERIPYDTTLATFGDFELGIGYYFHYDRDRVRDLIQLPPMDREPALLDGTRAAIFQHLLAQDAYENGYDETEEYVQHTRNMEMEWLSRFYSYNEFDLVYVPDESTLEAMYEERKDSFYKPLTFSFRHIFFQTRDRSDDEIEAAMDRAREALALIRSGSDFVEVANIYSESERKANVVGPFKTREVDPERAINEVLETTLLAMSPGDVSEIVKTRHGYHILLLDKLTPETYTQFTSARGGLVNELRRADMVAWQQSLFDENADDIHVNDPDPLFDEDAGADTVLFHAFDAKLTKGDFEFIHAGEMRQPDGQSEEAWRENVLDVYNSTFTYRGLASELAKQKDYDEIQGYQVYTSAMKTQNVYRAWLEDLSEEHLAENSITDEMIAGYYEENPVVFRKPQQVRVAEMTFNIAEHDPNDRYATFVAQSQAKEKADTAIKRLQAGEAFADIAKDMSESPTGFKGGDLGLIDTNTDLIPAVVARRALRLNEGDISEEAIRAGEAYYVVMAVSKPPQELYPLDSAEAREAATRALTSRMRTEFVNSIYDEMVPEGEVELAIDDVVNLHPSAVEQIKLTP